MEFVNLFRSTVSSAVSTVSSVLPGNPVTREYDPIAHIASAGPGMVWKIYSGCKKSTKQEVAIWVFEKKSIEKWPKRDKEALLESVKRGVSQLTRLRHPRLLVIEHPLEESRESFAFATEPIFASLANALGRVDNMPAIIPTELSDLKLEDVEIRRGILQLAEALAFLHNDAKILHRNVTPEAVIINRCGDWKLGGFDFCVTATNAPGQSTAYPLVEFDGSLHPYVQPSLDYLAPEYVVGGRCDSASDLFSLGVLSHAIFNKGKTIVDQGNNINTFQKNCKELKSLPPTLLRCVPEEFREYVKMCLNYTPDLRPDANQFTKIGYFDNLGVKTLNCLDSLCQLDNLQKSQFFKGLPNVLSCIPKRSKLHKVLPVLTAEYQSPLMVPFVLPTIFAIADNCTKLEFQSLVFPSLTPTFTMKSPIEIMLLLLQKMDLLLGKTAPEAIAKYLLPLVYSAIESNDTKIQELCLNIVPDIIQYVDATAMKTHLVPKLLRMTTQASCVSVKVNGLLCIGKLLDKVERWIVRDQILPELPKIASKDATVLTAVLGVYKGAFSNPNLGISKEACARSCLPFLIPLVVENCLNLNQFETFMALINEMLKKVEVEQRAKLEQLSAMQEEQRTGVDVSSVLGGSQTKVYSINSNGLTPELVPGTTPGKVIGSNGTLSLEEKQRLAREQEETLKFRSQKPLVAGSTAKPVSSGGVSISNRSGTLHTSSSTPKDLSSLIGSTNMAIRAPPSPMNPLQRPLMVSQSSTFSAPFIPVVPATVNYGANRPSKPFDKVDLSSFDNLLQLKSMQKSPMAGWSNSPSQVKPLGGVPPTFPSFPVSPLPAQMFPVEEQKSAAKSASSELHDLLN